MSTNPMQDDDGFEDVWPKNGRGRPGLLQRLERRDTEGLLVINNRFQGYLNSPARIALFGGAREGYIRWVSTRITHHWGIRVVGEKQGYRVDRKGRLNVRALTDELDAGAWPVRFRLARDPEDTTRLVFAGVVENG